MSITNEKRNGLAKTSQALGLHPIVAFGMIAVDSMLFAETMISAGTGWIITVPIALIFTIPCTLLQKFNFGDNWGTAIGKGVIVGILTAIPTPLPSLLTFGGGIVGTAKLLTQQSSKQLQSTSKSENDSEF